MLHRTRHLFIRQQTAVINAIRAHLAEFGIVAPVGEAVHSIKTELTAAANITTRPPLAIRRNEEPASAAFSVGRFGSSPMARVI